MSERSRDVAVSSAGVFSHTPAPLALLLEVQDLLANGLGGHGSTASGRKPKVCSF